MDAIVNGVAKGKYDIMYILYILAALLICNIFQYIFGEINNYFTTVHQAKIEKYIKMKMTRQVNNLDISYFDSPDFYNELQNVNMDSNALQSMIFYVMELLRSLISYVTTFAILFIFSWWAPLVLTIVFVPYMLVNKYYVQYVYMWNRGAIDNIRKREFLIGILGKKEAAMEERVFGFGNRFIEKYSTLWDKWFLEKISLLKKETLWKAASMLIPEVVKIGITLVLIINVLKHVISIGDYSMYSGLIIQLTGGVTSISYIIANLIQNKSRISLFDKFFEWKNNIPQLGEKTPSKKPFISFKNVSFKYPKTDNYVLKNVSFDIKPNECVALIGTNGAGKTTIIKLILRLYDATEGEITLDGINIKYYDKNKLQKIYSVFFQEFFHYPLTLKESITISDIENESDTDRIYNSCYMSRLDKLLKHMPNGICRLTIQSSTLCCCQYCSNQ